MKKLAIGILTTIILGICGALGGMYNDVQAMKAREPLLMEAIKDLKSGQGRMHDDIRDIRNDVRGFIIQRNNVKILKRRGK